MSYGGAVDVAMRNNNIENESTVAQGNKRVIIMRRLCVRFSTGGMTYHLLINIFIWPLVTKEKARR